MSPAPVTLLMAVHCHQPVGNFDFVFEEAFAKAYDPFLRVLERHPQIHLALHYSGCLLDWLEAHRPEFLKRIRGLVARAQVELLASGYYEPILPLIPETDRQGQIALMRDAIRTRFRTEAGGLWLTERVWEPDLPATLSRAGIRYTMVDTSQFAVAKPWLPAALQVQDESFWDLLGCYATDYAGSSLLLFPASKRLRYWMPFQPVERTLEFLKRLRRDEPVAVTFADDGEKFGLWPKTYRWVYEEGWLERFFSAIEAEQAWLTTATFRDYLEDAVPNGSVSLPCGSYEEMLEWSGGSFRNFFTKYPEANAMYHKMLRVSQQLQDVSGVECRVSSQSRSGSRRRGHSSLVTRHSKLIEQARDALYAGQCNCAYWHGVFGGLYLSHLRRAVYHHLIAAQQLADQAAGDCAASITVLDADGDGREETLLKTPAMELLVDPEEGGTVTEWILVGPRINLLDTLSRRYESYHDKLKSKPTKAAVPAGGVPASIHDVLGVKEENLTSHLIYDDHRRSAFLDYALQSLPALHEVVRSTWGERRLWSAGPFRWPAPTARPVLKPGRAATASGGLGDREGLGRRAGAPLRMTMVRAMPAGRIRKTIVVHGDRPAVDYLYELDGLSIPVVGLEFNLCLRDERYLREAGQRSQVTQFTVEELGTGVSLSLSLDPPATLMHVPIETVSESEEGLERTYQGLSVMCLWEVSPTREEARARSWKCRVQWTVDAAPSSASARTRRRKGRPSVRSARSGRFRANVEGR